MHSYLYLISQRTLSEFSSMENSRDGKYDSFSSLVRSLLATDFKNVAVKLLLKGATISLIPILSLSTISNVCFALRVSRRSPKFHTPSTAHQEQFKRTKITSNSNPDCTMVPGLKAKKVGGATVSGVLPEPVCLICGEPIHNMDKSRATAVQKDKQWKNHVKSASGAVMVPATEVEAMHSYDFPTLCSHFSRARKLFSKPAILC